MRGAFFKTWILAATVWCAVCGPAVAAAAAQSTAPAVARRATPQKRVKGPNDWLRRMVAYLRDHIDDEIVSWKGTWVPQASYAARDLVQKGERFYVAQGAAPAGTAPDVATTGQWRLQEPIPVVWADPGHTTIRGSPNQKWLTVADGIATQNPWWIRFAIERYRREAEVGHEEFEELTGSHAWQHLTAHAAIRVLARRLLAAHSSLPDLRELLAENDNWWAEETYLLRTFWCAGAGQVVAPGARNSVTKNGWSISSQRDAIAAWIVGRQELKVPQRSAALRWTDTYVQELIDRLRRDNDDLAASRMHPPKLAYPVFIERHGADFRAYWQPGPDVLDPVLYAECVGDKPRFVDRPQAPIRGDFAAVGTPAATRSPASN